MSDTGQAADGGSPLRRRGVLLSAVALLAVAVTVAVVLAMRNGGQAAGATEAAGGCDSYGPAWVRTYNKAALAAGNPVQMLGACCRSTSRAGVHHCVIKLTLRGTPKSNIGCESVDLGPDGLPAGVGKHENCALLKNL